MHQRSVIPERTPPLPPWCLSVHSFWAFLRLKWRVWPVASSVLVDVFMSNDLVGNPVEDIEDEKGQREGSPGDRVYPFGSVHKLFPHDVDVLRGWRLRVGSGNRVFNGRAILHRHALTRVVPSKIKAALAHIFVLKNTKTIFQTAAAQTSWPEARVAAVL